MKRQIIAAAAAAILSFGATSAEAATQIVDGNGVLTGATGVVVNGTTYDVQFVDSSCVALFSGCDLVSDFTFQNSTDASAAAQALLDQVYLDTSAGDFDTTAWFAIFGCGNTDTFCDVFIPYLPGVTVAGARSGNAGGDSVILTTFGSTFDLSNSNWAAWATFTPTSAVPEPSAWALMLLGFGAVGFALRRRRQTELTLRRA